MMFRSHVAVLLSVCMALTCLPAFAQTPATHPFTVRDDLAFAQFGDVWSGAGGQVYLSPKGDWVAVQISRASIADNKFHDEVRFYSVAAISSLLASPTHAPVGSLDPIWTLKVEATPSEMAGTAIQTIEWLEDNRHVALLQWTDGRRQLFLADLSAREVVPLTDAEQDVLSFSIRDAQHFVYTIPSASLVRAFEAEQRLPSHVATGQNLFPLLYPGHFVKDATRADLWAVHGGAPTPVVDPATGEPVFLYGDGIANLSLSRAGDAVVTIRALPSVPLDWIDKYPPPYPESAYRLRAGPQDLNAPNGWSYAGEYVYIPLDTGSSVSLTDAPAAVRAGWWEAGAATPVWSADDSSVLLPGTFANVGLHGTSQPCFAIVRIVSRTMECVRPMLRNLANGFEKGYDRVDSVRFEDTSGNRVALVSRDYVLGVDKSVVYVRSSQSVWSSEPQAAAPPTEQAIEINVRATFRDTPKLIATNQKTGAVAMIYDPNPQLSQITFVTPEAYAWTDDLGHRWRGLLYRPLGYSPAKRYPLVIQTHGFREDRYAPSGGFPSAFIGQELTASGIAVLHVKDCDGRSTPTEGPCNVREYEAAVAALSREGLVDQDRVGLIGFSRTVYYVMKALSTSAIHFRAASITDGVTLGYMNYLNAVGADPIYNQDDEAVIGSSPIGDGILDWLRNSPEFNIDKVTTPLRIVATRSGGVLAMWEPYALLRKLNRPVDLIVLNTDQHVVTDPQVRYAAQQGNLDWFRFWLQDYEDPDPDKNGQYLRWRELRKRQDP